MNNLEDIIVDFAKVFSKALQMLLEEIEENKESNYTFNDIDVLANNWNNLCDKYLDEE